MDHEFGTTDLGPDAVGWDWFSFQLSDRRELMLFLIRNKDGNSAPASSGTLVEPDGSTRHLTRDEMQIQVAQTWKSNQSGATYPARWNVSVPSAGIELAAAPYMADQEMRLSIVYWEGAVAVSGRSNGNAVQGDGFIELTGYK
jgi:predicted secreted hydrolase